MYKNGIIIVESRKKYTRLYYKNYERLGTKMNKRFMQRLTLVASRLLILMSVMVMTVWVLKYDMATDHDTVQLIRWLSVSAGMFLLGGVLDSVSVGLKSRLDSNRSKNRVELQKQELAIRENRLYMNINI